MTFNPIVPLSTQSPGIFPGQNNTNFTRLKTLISGDHIFNDTAAANDGTHKQVTITFRADPVSLPTDTNGMMYSKLDTDISNAAQLYWYNGTTIEQMTGQTLIISGKSNLAPGGTYTILSDPGYTYIALAWGAEESTNDRYKYRLMMKQATPNASTITEQTGSQTNANFAFTNIPGPTHDLIIFNGSSTSTLTFVWTVTVTRLKS